ncbi:MAG: dockerin type I domain-containing protein [Planctomycetota bacterium]
MITRAACLVAMCGVAVGANAQLLNPDFELSGGTGPNETDFASWSSFGGPDQISADTTELFNGFASAKLFGGFDVPFNTHVLVQFQVEDVTPGDEWEVAALVGELSTDALQPGVRGFISIVYEDAEGVNLVDTAIDLEPGMLPQDEFGRMSVTDIAPLAAETVQVVLGLQQEVITATGSIRFDDTELNLLSTGNDIELRNGGFEEIVFGRKVEGWTTFGDFAEPSGNIFTAEDFTFPPAIEGDQSVLMFGQFNGDENGNDSGIFQSVPASAGEEWTAAAQVFNDDVDPIGEGNVAVISLVFRDANGVVLADNPVQAADSTLTPGVWVPVSSTAVAPAGTAEAEIVLVYSQAPAPDGVAGNEPLGIVRWDDTSLTVGTAARFCADVNDDGSVDSSDFFAWVSAFGADPRTPAQEVACDVNNDAECTSGDFFAWVSAFGLGLEGPLCPALP